MTAHKTTETTTMTIWREKNYQYFKLMVLWGRAPYKMTKQLVVVMGTLSKIGIRKRDGNDIIDREKERENEKEKQ